MATVSEVSAGSSCWGACIPDQMGALLYLLSRIAGVADPATVAAGASCWSACIPDQNGAVLYLLNAILAGGGGGGGGGAAADIVTCSDVDPVAAPTTSCGVWFNRVNSALYLWNSTSGTWVIKA